MSRVGKLPVLLPAGVDVTLHADQISVKAAGGTLNLAQNPLVKIVSEVGKLSFRRPMNPALRMRCPEPCASW